MEQQHQYAPPPPPQQQQPEVVGFSDYPIPLDPKALNSGEGQYREVVGSGGESATLMQRQERQVCNAFSKMSRYRASAQTHKPRLSNVRLRVRYARLGAVLFWGVCEALKRPAPRFQTLSSLSCLWQLQLLGETVSALRSKLEKERKDHMTTKAALSEAESSVREGKASFAETQRESMKISLANREILKASSVFVRQVEDELDQVSF